MSRVFIALEMGGNLGHLVPCLQIAEVLRSRGDDVIFAVQDLRTAAEFLGPMGFRYVQAPRIRRTEARSKPPVNYSEILIGAGYSDKHALLGMVQAWHQLMAMFGAECVLADHAPTALLAARLSSIPCVATGSGFAVPPIVVPMRSIRSWEAVQEQHLHKVDRAINEAITTVASNFGNSQMKDLSGLFGSDYLLATFPELDHYGARECDQYVGPIYSMAKTSPVSWQESKGKKILAYLRPDTPRIAMLFAALRSCDAEVVCEVPGLRQHEASRLEASRMRIFLEPVSLAPLLENADLMISYGGGGVTAETLLSGTAMLISPRYVEQYLTGRRVEQLGAGMLLGSNRSVEAISEKLNGLLENPRYSVNAKRFAAKYADYRPEQAVRRIVDAVHARAEAGNVG